MDKKYRVYCHLTEEEFFAGLNEAKKEGVCTNDKDWVDIGLLLKNLWQIFSEGRLRVAVKPAEIKPKVEIIPDTKPTNEEVQKEETTEPVKE